MPEKTETTHQQTPMGRVEKRRGEQNPPLFYFSRVTIGLKKESDVIHPVIRQIQLSDKWTVMKTFNPTGSCPACHEEVRDGRWAHHILLRFKSISQNEKLKNIKSGLSLAELEEDMWIRELVNGSRGLRTRQLQGILIEWQSQRNSILAQNIRMGR